MAPEYVMRGNYSVKPDAFSFGVVVLEIVTGRKNNNSSNSQQSEDLLTMVSGSLQAAVTIDHTIATVAKHEYKLPCSGAGMGALGGRQGDEAGGPVPGRPFP
jgi:hypothetical protein